MPRAGGRGGSRSPCSASSVTGADGTTGNLRAMEIAEVKVERDENGRRIITPVGEAMEIPCDLALLAIGFEGVEHMALLDGLDLSLTRRGTVSCGSDWQTDAPGGVFVCGGDAHRGGASLIVWAIAEGRSAAHAVDAFLMGESDLRAVRPGTCLWPSCETRVRRV